MLEVIFLRQLALGDFATRPFKRQNNVIICITKLQTYRKIKLEKILRNKSNKTSIDKILFKSFSFPSRELISRAPFYTSPVKFTCRWKQDYQYHWSFS